MNEIQNIYNNATKEMHKKEMNNKVILTFSSLAIFNQLTRPLIVVPCVSNSVISNIFI